MTQHLFVYGTLAPGRPNEHVLAGVAGDWQEATMVGTLHALGWGAGLGFPGIVPDPSGNAVEGLVFTSPELTAHWDRLDRFEGPAYQRITAPARLASGRTVQAQVYAIRDTR